MELSKSVIILFYKHVAPTELIIASRETSSVNRELNIEPKIWYLASEIWHLFNH